MKSKFIYSINFLWSSFIAFSFPISFGLIYLSITGHSKGYSYDLGSEKDISVIFGFIELLIWLVLALPSNIYVFRMTARKGKTYLLIPIVLYISFAAMCIMIMGGRTEYSKGVFIVNDIKICAFSLHKNHICKFLFAFKSNF